MKRFKRQIVFGILSVGLLFQGCQSSVDIGLQIRSSQESGEDQGDQHVLPTFHYETLFDLEVFSGVPLQERSLKEHAVLVYLNQVYCDTCVYREFQFLREFQKKHEVELILVANLEEFNGIRNDVFLKKLKRVAQIEFPILIEKEQGDLGLPDLFTIGLLNLNTQHIEYYYHPKMEMDRWPWFEEKTIQCLKQGNGKKCE